VSTRIVGPALARLTRRDVMALLPAAALATLAPRPSRAAPQLAVTDVGERLFVITGGGGNVTVLDSDEGVLMVDGGSPEHSAAVLKLVHHLTGTRKVHTLFNTHWHWDHTGSNLTLGSEGTRIIAHENTRLWLGTDIDCAWQHRQYRRLPQQARPTKTFYTTGTLSFGGQTIDYGYLPQAHTDGDIYVFFRNAGVLAVGDVLSVGSYPVLDYCTNGWIGGMANATQSLIGLADVITRLVPGTGPVQTRADLEAEHQMLSDLKLKLSKLLAQGMSVADMLAAAPTRDYDAKWGDPRLFVANAWPGLVQRARELGVAIV
jgi:glyoxylase-like metal-dependent hydrolase (beta-lactamase superfamily II)